MSEDISVVICAYTEDRWADLVSCVDAVRRQSLLAAEIVVVVDHNPVLLARVRAQLGGVVAIENAEQRGLSGARNSGVAAACGAIIAFLDEDAIPAPDWLAELRAGYDAPDVLGVGGAIEPLWLCGRPDWFPAEFGWVVGCTYRGMPATTAAVRNLIGCNMSFRREVFAAVGGFRHGIGRVGTRPVGCEETELCIRARQYCPDGLMRYEPQARVSHRVPPQRASWAYFCSRCYAEGLSKALVSQFVGSRDGLATERTYVTRTLPQGVLQGMVALVRRRESAGLARAGAIIAGLALTTVGYIVGIISLLRARSSSMLDQRRLA
jgi:glucosyl-dolichyl phosphate glucuronosyltransferase